MHFSGTDFQPLEVWCSCYKSPTSAHTRQPLTTIPSKTAGRLCPDWTLFDNFDLHPTVVTSQKPSVLRLAYPNSGSPVALLPVIAPFLRYPPSTRWHGFPGNLVTDLHLLQFPSTLLVDSPLASRRGFHTGLEVTPSSPPRVSLQTYYVGGMCRYLPGQGGPLCF